MTEPSTKFSDSNTLHIEMLMQYKEKYEKILQQRVTAVRKWQSANKDKVAEYKKKYAQKNKEIAIKNSTKYNNNNKDKYKEYQLLYRSSRLLRQLPFWGEDDIDHEIQ
jgi:hypothetical protein